MSAPFSLRSAGQIVLSGMAAGVMAPFVYVLVVAVDAYLGYDFIPWLISAPTEMFRPWIVAPGATLLGAALGWYLSVRSLKTGTKLVRAALIGAGFGLLNVPVAFQMGIFAYWLRGGDNPVWAPRGWLPDVPWMVWHSFPVAVPCGVLLGLLVASLCRNPARVSDEASD
jgi:hypothetical protein